VWCGVCVCVCYSGKSEEYELGVGLGTEGSGELLAPEGEIQKYKILEGGKECLPDPCLSFKEKGLSR
jgi:hypothetical protein